MDTRTAAIAADSTRVYASHALKLRVVLHKYAPQIAVHARAVERHARKLLRLHARTNAESIAFAGPYFEEHPIVGFDEPGSIAGQQQDTDAGGAVSLKRARMTSPVSMLRRHCSALPQTIGSPQTVAEALQPKPKAISNMHRAVP
jgi:hypothetical protein